MVIGVLKEIKANENRAAMTPAGVEMLKSRGHRVLVQADAGARSGFADEDYLKSGAEIFDAPEDIYARAELILRVKAPQPSEYGLLREGQVYFSFLHLAASLERTKAMLDSGVVGLAYETIQTDRGRLPLLTPMSEVAGRMAVQEGAKYLEMAHGGHGVLLGGAPGVDPGTVLILGGGVVGLNAAKTACGLGAKVYILETNLERLRYLSDVMPGNCFLMASSPAAVRDRLPTADLVIGAVLIPGARTPKLVTREMLGGMKKGAVLVDVAVDQGGCFETSRETFHSDPIFVVDDVVHYCVTNMPGAVPRTATLALTNATLPYLLRIAGRGWKRAVREDVEIRRGLNVVAGRVAYEGVARALDLEYTPAAELV